MEDVPLAEKRGQGLTTPLMDVVTRCRSYATWNSQGPQLVVVLVSADQRGRIHSVLESDIVYVNLVWSDSDDWT